MPRKRESAPIATTASTSAATTASFNATGVQKASVSDSAAVTALERNSSHSLDDLVDSAKAVVDAREELIRLTDAVEAVQEEVIYFHKVLVLGCHLLFVAHGLVGFRETRFCVLRPCTLLGGFRTVLSEVKIDIEGTMSLLESLLRCFASEEESVEPRAVKICDAVFVMDHGGETTTRSKSSGWV